MEEQNIPEIARRPHVTPWIEGAAVLSLLAAAGNVIAALSMNEPAALVGLLTAAGGCVFLGVLLFGCAAALRLLSRISQQLEVAPMAVDVRRMLREIEHLSGEVKARQRAEKEAALQRQLEEAEKRLAAGELDW